MTAPGLVLSLADVDPAHPAARDLHAARLGLLRATHPLAPPDTHPLLVWALIPPTRPGLPPRAAVVHTAPVDPHWAPRWLHHLTAGPLHLPAPGAHARLVWVVNAASSTRHHDPDGTRVNGPARVVPDRDVPAWAADRLAAYLHLDGLRVTRSWTARGHRPDGRTVTTRMHLVDATGTVHDAAALAAATARGRGPTRAYGSGLLLPQEAPRSPQEAPRSHGRPAPATQGPPGPPRAAEAVTAARAVAR